MNDDLFRLVVEVIVAAAVFVSAVTIIGAIGVMLSMLYAGWP